MRARFSLFLILAACGGAETTVVGEVTDDAVTHVWVVGGPEPALVSDGAFRLQGLRGDTLDLRFAAEGEERARMEILGVPDGRRLTLHGVWTEDGRAFPSSVDLDGGGTVVVNGLRLAAPDALPRELDVQASVLAVSGAGEALLVRPADERLPDLRVVVTPGTLARTPDGDPAELNDLEFGDSVRVRGAAESGYVIAAEVVTPRPLATEANSGPDGPAAAAAAAARASGSVAERARERGDRARGKEKGKGQGKGKGKEKGKGKGKG